MHDEHPDHMRSLDDLRLRLTLRWHLAHIKKYAWLFILLLDFSLMDAWTTIAFMHDLGVETETHAWIRRVSEWWGPLYGPLIGKGCQYATFYFASILAPRFCIVLGLILCTSYMLGAIINVMAL